MNCGGITRLSFAAGGLFAIEGGVEKLIDNIGEFYNPLRWLLVLAFVLTIADLRWGVPAARKRGEKIRFSRGARRTINKLLDYVTWVTIGGLIDIIVGQKLYAVLGITVDFPIGQLAVLLIIYSIELDSCLSNYAEARNVKKRFNFLGWVGKKTSMEIIDKNNENENKN